LELATIPLVAIAQTAEKREAAVPPTTRCTSTKEGVTVTLRPRHR
jgi:hypothetical protein